MEWFSDMPKVAKPGGYTSLFDLNPLLCPLYTLQKTCVDQQVAVLVV